MSPKEVFSISITIDFITIFSNKSQTVFMTNFSTTVNPKPKALPTERSALKKLASAISKTLRAMSEK